MNRWARSGAALVLVALAGCASTPTAPQGIPAQGGISPRQDIVGLGNYAQVSLVLHRGAQPTAEGFAALKKLGIKTVVNLRLTHSDRDKLRGLGLRYAHIPSAAWNPDDASIARFLSIVTDPNNQPVFVHCQHGADRTGAAVASYRIVAQGWTPKQAEQELARFGFHPIWARIPEWIEHFDADAMRKRVAARPIEILEVVE
jgi:tyrosine-protein phosphatase SIW14